VITREDLAIVLSYADGGVNEWGITDGDRAAVDRVQAEVAAAPPSEVATVVWSYTADPLPPPKAGA
jgi:hypothetical protein